MRVRKYIAVVDAAIAQQRASQANPPPSSRPPPLPQEFEAFDPKEMQKLALVVEQAENMLQEAERRPRTAARLSEKKKR